LLIQNSGAFAKASGPSTARQWEFLSDHCFEYLRQVVSCNIDLTLEPFSVEKDTFTVWGVKHQCTDFEKVSEWAMSMRMSDDLGIVG
jgi:hypothetical protein